MVSPSSFSERSVWPTWTGISSAPESRRAGAGAPPEPLERRPDRGGTDRVAREALARDRDAEDLLLQAVAAQLRRRLDAAQVVLEHLELLLEVAGAVPVGDDGEEQRARVAEVVVADEGHAPARAASGCAARPGRGGASPRTAASRRRRPRSASSTTTIDAPVLGHRVGLGLVHLVEAEEVLLEGTREPLLDLARGRAGHEADDEPLAHGEVGELLARHGERARRCRRRPPRRGRRRRSASGPSCVSTRPRFMAQRPPARALAAPGPAASVTTLTAMPSASIGEPEVTTRSPAATPVATAPSLAQEPAHRDRPAAQRTVRSERRTRRAGRSRRSGPPRGARPRRGSASSWRRTDLGHHAHPEHAVRVRHGDLDRVGAGQRVGDHADLADGALEASSPRRADRRRGPPAPSSTSATCVSGTGAVASTVSVWTRVSAGAPGTASHRARRPGGPRCPPRAPAGPCRRGSSGPWTATAAPARGRSRPRPT